VNAVICVSETVCEVNFDSASNCIILSGQIDDVRRAETDFTKKCLEALCRDTVTVSQPGIMNTSPSIYLIIHELYGQ